MTNRRRILPHLICLACLPSLAGCPGKSPTPPWRAAAVRFNSHSSDQELEAVAKQIVADPTSHLTFVQATQSMACADRAMLLGTVCILDAGNARWLETAFSLDAITDCRGLDMVYWEVPIAQQLQHLQTYLAPGPHFQSRAMVLAARTIDRWTTTPEWKAAVLALPQDIHIRFATLDTPQVKALIVLTSGQTLTPSERDNLVAALPAHIREPFLRATAN
ncbi:MAG: hypothetical protein ACK5VN_09650 [Phycisphaerae bacterium]